MSSVQMYPPTTQSPRIKTFTARARTEPAPSGFMRSVMRRPDYELEDDGIVMVSQPEKKITQEEQDALDEKARTRAMKNLVNSWQERLQLISVITTFFASTEAAMLVNTKPTTADEWRSGALKASNASLLGALIVHVYAAILSFLGAFLLIRYKLKEATRQEMIAEGLVNSPLQGVSMHNDVEGNPADLGLRGVLTNNGTATDINDRRNSYPVEPPIISANPHIEQVGPFMSTVPSHLLSRTHALCVFLAAVGFVLAMVGILCYAWALQPREVSIFASAVLGAAALAMAVLLI